MGQIDLALEALETALADWKDEDHLREEHSLAAFLYADCLVESERIEEAGEWLSRAMKWSAKLGYDNFLVNAGRQARPFLEVAQINWPSKQLSSIIERVAEYQVGMDQLETPEKSLESPSLHLEVNAFGSGEVRRNGEIIPGSLWRSNRARALFFFILDNQSVRKEDVALEFWPEFSPARVNSNFHATLWRVRNALGGTESVIFADGKYSLHPDITVWYDAAEFQECLHKANVDGLSPSQQTDLLHSAVDLYTGGFLDSIFMNWADQRRKELQNEYLQTLLILAELELANSSYRTTQELCQKAFEIDPFHDQAHLLLMNCLVESGSSAAANAHYQDYKKTLRKELDTEPSEAIQTFVEELSKMD
jgi:two-component SAPR family response regulator